MFVKLKNTLECWFDWMGRELVTNLSDLSVISGTPDGRRREMTSRSHFLTSTHTHNKVNVYQFINTKPLFYIVKYLKVTACDRNNTESLYIDSQ